MTLDIFWPSFSTEGGHLLYLITEPVLDKSQKGHCRVKQHQNINPLNLKLTGEHLPTEAPKKPPPREPSEKEKEAEEEDDDEGAPGEDDEEDAAPYAKGADDELEYVPHVRN